MNFQLINKFAVLLVICTHSSLNKIYFNVL